MTPGEPPDTVAVDATRRTHLANERTYLAWWRTALAALALAVGVGRLLPEVLGEQATWPFVALGVGYGVVGVAVGLYGLRRHRAVDSALARGGYAPAGPRALVAFTAAVTLLGAATVAVILAGA
jgi:putative membrane protein